MSTKRRVVGWFDRRLVRRAVITPIVLIAALGAVALGPLLVVGAALRDRVKKQPRWPRLRITALVIGALVIEACSIVASLLVWILTGFGFLGNERWRWHMHRRLMGRYTRTMLGLIVRVIGTKLEWRDSADLSAGPVILIARHTSFFDALIPATVLSHRNQLLSHHVVTHGLRYAPCIDIVGHRFPNRFIKRTPGEGSSELGKIAKIGNDLTSRSAAIIFPEGTFRSPARFTREVRRIRRRQPEVANRVEHWEHVLPPRTNGTYALLQGAPNADVVVCTNTGLESFGSIKDILDRPYANHRVVVETWRIARADIPEDADGFASWLFDQFEQIDGWVAANQHPSANQQA